MIDNDVQIVIVVQDFNFLNARPQVVVLKFSPKKKVAVLKK